MKQTQQEIDCKYYACLTITLCSASGKEYYSTSFLRSNDKEKILQWVDDERVEHLPSNKGEYLAGWHKFTNHNDTVQLSCNFEVK